MTTMTNAGGMHKVELSGKALHDVNTRITKARTALLMDAPFFAHLMLRLEFVLSDLNDTAWTNGKYLGLNPEFVLKLSKDSLVFVLAHEASHCGHRHMCRRGNRTPEKWFMACDYAINPLLVSGGMTMPKEVPGLIDKGFNGMSAEQIYSKLPDTLPPKAQKACVGTILDAENPIEESNDWAVAVVRAAQHAKQIGNLPADIELLVNNLMHPKIPWYDELREALVTSLVRTEQSWARPNRRLLHQGIYLPSDLYNMSGTIVVGTDTSGSIGPDELDQFAAEISSIVQETTPEDIYIVSCDAKVQAVQHLTPDDMPIDPDMLKFKGGGGTSFTPVFEWVKDEQVEPDVLVYLTDMMGDFPDEPEYPTIWVSSSGDQYQPPFGRLIELPVGG